MAKFLATKNKEVLVSLVKFKFLSLTLASFLFLGSAMADCLDLTGRYMCAFPGSSQEFLYEFSQNADGSTDFSMFIDGRNVYGVNWTPDGSLAVSGWRIVCNEDRVRHYHERFNMIIDYHLEDAGMSLVRTDNVTGTNVQDADEINALDEEDYNPRWPTRTMRCQRLY